MTLSTRIFGSVDFGEKFGTTSFDCFKNIVCVWLLCSSNKDNT